MTSTFIGIDLAWQSNKNHTGIVVLEGNKRGAEIIDYSKGITNLDEIDKYIKAFKTSNTVIAVDAPLIVKNKNGQRPCEKLISKKFGSRHASAHSSNLSKYPQPGGAKLATMLDREGFKHNPLQDQYIFNNSCWYFEVYPHPALIVLFGLDRIIKYKNGRVDDKRNGLEILRNHIRNKILMGNPSIRQNNMLHDLLQYNLQILRGRDLKQYEDVLDGLICAYLALYYWTWGAEKNEMIGDLETGYIMNPKHPL